TDRLLLKTKRDQIKNRHSSEGPGFLCSASVTIVLVTVLQHAPRPHQDAPLPPCSAQVIKKAAAMPAIKVNLAAPNNEVNNISFFSTPSLFQSGTISSRNCHYKKNSAECS